MPVPQKWSKKSIIAKESIAEIVVDSFLAKIRWIIIYFEIVTQILLYKNLIKNSDTVLNFDESIYE